MRLARKTIHCLATFTILIGLGAHSHAQLPVPDDMSRRVVAAIGADDLASLWPDLPSKDSMNARLSSGDTPLVVAAALGRVNIMQALVEHGANIDATSARGWTPLMTAIFFGQRESVDLLLQRGAKADITGDDGATARSIALWRGYSDLAARFPALERKPTEGDLLAAIAAADYARVDSLLAAGIRPDAVDGAGNPAMLIAAAAGDRAIIQRLLRAGSKVDTPGQRGATALIVAVQQNRIDIVKLLLAAGADPQHRTDDGASPITVAEGLGYSDLVQLFRSNTGMSPNDEGGLIELAAAARTGDDVKAASLLASGVSADGGLVRGKLVVPLSVAAYKGSAKTVRVLLDGGATVDRADDNGNTPLMAAIAGNNPGVATLLMQHYASVHATNKAGANPFEMARAAGWIALGGLDLFSRQDYDSAVQHGDSATVQEMLNRHRDWALLRDEKGWYPIMYAIQVGSLKTVAALISAGSPVDLPAMDATVPSPLMLAANEGNADIVGLLLANGADPTRQDGADKTAGDFAKQKGFIPIATTLSVARKEYAKRINAGLAALGYLPKPDEEWSARNRNALASFYAAFPQLASYAPPLALQKAINSTFRVCNGRAEKIWLAAVLQPSQLPYSPEPVDAWWSLEPGSCKWFRAGDPIVGRISDTKLWIHAEAGSFWWGGSESLCLPKATRVLTKYPAEQGSVCSGDTRPAKFYIMDSRSANPQVIKSSTK